MIQLKKHVTVRREKVAVNAFAISQKNQQVLEIVSN